MTTRHHDLVVIGTGSGNSIVDDRFADLDVAIVEKGVFGGTCLNVGCIPTKMLVLPADRVVEAADSARLGVSFPPGQADWRAIRDRVFGRIDPIAAGGEEYRRGLANVTVYDREARFVGPMRLDTGTGVEITADRWVVAAGGRPRLLDVPGLDAVDPARGVHTSDTIMRVDELPLRTAVVGGGYVAAELSHVLQSLGSDVTWVHRGETLLGHLDREIARAFTDLARERFDLRLGSTVTAASYDGSVHRLAVKGPEGERTVEADAVLLAVGRVPNTDLLDVAAAGLATTDDGRLVVDSQQRTSVPDVWALGDISTDFPLKHVANHEARVVQHNLLHAMGREGEARESDHRFVPSAVFTHPQIASVGATEQELEDAGRAYRAKTQKFGDVAYGWALEDTTGLCKVLVDPESLQILGAHLMGPMSSVLVQTFIQAMSFGQRADDVARGQYWIHPALSEVVENALLGVL
ncbi:mycothione reductase [Lapillicoccus jejuensis]|uniref:Mycothione reductase n=1 Tax=Lapillicoccus jejuensis TaxID=402171 RepID=A0A542E4Z7_9MICO|nr:mycothione reductase [Lapillicoccus jejuensis]TQJ10349.1 mycothione reductase [Lapillicoccus jejuensis]